MNPDQIKLEAITKKKIWEFISSSYFKLFPDGSVSDCNGYYRNFMHEILLRHTDLTHEDIDDKTIYDKTKEFILKVSEGTSLNFLKHYLHYFYPDNRSKNLISIIKNVQLNLSIECTSKTVFIETKLTGIEAENIQSCEIIIKEQDHKGALKHIGNAQKYFNEKLYSDSIRESIHAVESVCKRISGKPKSTLTEALDALKAKGIEIHPALKAGLDKIYAYTSDEKGIRHASIDFETNCDQADAQFMLGACASFISYLCQKAEIA